MYEGVCFNQECSCKTSIKIQGFQWPLLLFDEKSHFLQLKTRNLDVIVFLVNPWKDLLTMHIVYRKLLSGQPLFSLLSYSVPANSSLTGIIEQVNGTGVCISLLLLCKIGHIQISLCQSFVSLIITALQLTRFVDLHGTSSTTE